MSILFIKKYCICDIIVILFAYPIYRKGVLYLTINERVKFVRNELNLTQKEFGEKITVAQTYLSQIEKGDRNVTAKILKIICSEFNVNEEWLNSGTGEIFVETSGMTLDEYAKSRNLTDVEFEIIRAYMELPEDFRKMAVEKLAAIFERQKEKEGPPDYWAEAPKTPEELEKAYPPVEGPSKKEVG